MSSKNNNGATSRARGRGRAQTLQGSLESVEHPRPGVPVGVNEAGYMGRGRGRGGLLKLMASGRTPTVERQLYDDRDLRESLTEQSIIYRHQHEEAKPPEKQQYSGQSTLPSATLKPNPKHQSELGIGLPSARALNSDTSHSRLRSSRIF